MIDLSKFATRLPIPTGKKRCPFCFHIPTLSDMIGHNFLMIPYPDRYTTEYIFIHISIETGKQILVPKCLFIYFICRDCGGKFKSLSTKNLKTLYRQLLTMAKSKPLSVSSVIRNRYEKYRGTGEMKW